MQDLGRAISRTLVCSALHRSARIHRLRVASETGPVIAPEVLVKHVNLGCTLLAVTLGVTALACGGEDGSLLLDVRTYGGSSRDITRPEEIDLGQLSASRFQKSPDWVVLEIGSRCIIEFDRRSVDVCTFYTLYGCVAKKATLRWTAVAAAGCALEVPGFDETATLEYLVDSADNPREPVSLWFAVSLPSSDEFHWLWLAESQ